MKNENILNDILEAIELENTENGLMGEDASNERLAGILEKHNLEDDADKLEEFFGSDGFNLIRDAENGVY